MYKIFIYNLPYRDGRKGRSHVDEDESTSIYTLEAYEEFGAGTMISRLLIP